MLTLNGHQIWNLDQVLMKFGLLLDIITLHVCQISSKKKTFNGDIMGSFLPHVKDWDFLKNFYDLDLFQPKYNTSRVGPCIGRNLMIRITITGVTIQSVAIL